VRRAIALALLLATALPAGAAAGSRVFPHGALGTSAAELGGFYAAEPARAERRFHGGRAARRAFSAGLAAYLQHRRPAGLAPRTGCRSRGAASGWPCASTSRADPCSPAHGARRPW